MYDNALKKYKNFQFESIGHSQGSLLARLLSDKSINSIQLNPAYKAETLKDNEYIIRSSGDAVSALTVQKKEKFRSISIVDQRAYDNNQSRNI